MKTLFLLVISLFSLQLLHAKTVACDNVSNAGLIYHNSNTDGLVKFCTAWQPAPISETQGASGGSGGSLLYQWQYGFNGSSWEDISISAGQNSNINLGSSALINFFSNNNISTDESIFFRRGVKRPDCSDYLYSNLLEYRVYPDLSDANPPLQAGIFCDFEDAQHCVGVGSSNNTDTYEYIWEFSFDNEDYFYTSTTFPENYCYDAGTTAYFKVGSRLIGSPCEYEYKSPLQIVTQLTPEWELDITAVSCEGANDGSFSISDESGNSDVLTDDYTYSIDNGQNWQSSATFNGLGVGNYTVSIQTLFCGSYSESFSINASPSPSLNDIDITDESDCGAADARIEIELSGGTGNFEYRLSSTSWQSSPNFNGLSAGNYDAYGRNADGSCETFLTQVTIDAPLSPSINNISLDEISDCNENDGRISIEANGGDGPLRYSIDEGDNWSNSSTFNNLSGGSYEAGVQNQDGTCTQFETVNLTEPNAPIIQEVSSNDPTDCDSDNGSISIEATLSGSSLEYSINNGQNWSANHSFSNLGPGTYQIKVRKSDGSCEVAYNNSVILSSPSSPEASSIVVEQPSNCQVDDGEINIYPSNSEWGFSIDGGQSWQEGSGLFSQLSPGTYIPFIRNGDGTCAHQAGAPIELSYPDQPTITDIDYGNPSDWCTSDGYLIIETSGGAGPLEYTRNGITWGSSPEFIGGLSSALLSPGVRNADGSCETFWEEEILISPPDRPSIDAIIENADSGCGANDGSIMIEASGGIGAYDYSIDDGVSWQSSPLFDGYPSANYDIAIRNKDGSCTITDDAYIPTLLKPRIQSFDIQTPSDCGLADASISISGDRGTGDYEYTIDGGQNWTSQSTISDLAPGEYILGIRNSNGFCEVIEGDPVTINEPPHRIITSVEVIQPSDCDLDDGELTLFVQGVGISEYSIDAGENWQNSRTFRDLAPGEYFPVVRNTNGSCYQAYDESFSLAYPPRPEYDDITTRPTSDCDVNDGEMTIILTAGTGSFEYSLNDGNSWQSSSTFTGLSATTYGKIAVRNSDGTCYEEYASSVEITEPPSPSFGASDIDQPSDCELDDGFIETNAQQGIGSFEYSFDGGESWQDADFIDDLSPGQYLQGIRNADGTCEVFRNTPVELDYPPSPSIANINSEQPSDCGTDDGSISISAANGTGSFQYSIDGGSSWKNNGNFNNLAPGQFEIAIRNSNGTCEIFENQEIEFDYPPSPAIANINSEQPSDCGTDDGSISISAANGTGSFQYSIDGGSSWKNNGSFNNLAPGQFEIAIRNSNGTCEIFENQEIELDYPPSPSIANINSEQPSDCGTDDGSISISAANGTGSFQYSIDGGSSWKNNGTFNNLAPGQFEIAIRNSNGTCEIFENQEVELDYPPSPAIANINFEQPSDCGTDDGSISISAANGTGSFQYSIDGGSSWKNNGTFNNLAPGQFEIAIRNSNGTCEIFENQEIELDYPPSPAIANINSEQPSDCGTDDGSISISAANGTGSFQYSIDGGSSWKNNGTFNNLAPGQFDIAIRNSNGTCEIFENQEVELDYPPSPAIANINSEQPSDCGTDDGSISISAANGTGSFQYSIDGGSSWKNNGTFNNLAPGQFEIAIRNSNGTCEIFENQEIEFDYPPSPSIANINSEQPSDCGTDDGSISISAANGTGNFQYSIDGGDSWKNNGNFNNLAPGQFEIAIRNSNGTCEIFENQEIELDYPPSPSIANINSEQPSDCGTDDGSISISAANGTGSFQYSIDGGSSWKNNGNFNNLAPGQFEIAIRNSNGTCEIFENQEIELDYPPSPAIANIDFEQPSDCGTDDGEIRISGQDGVGSYSFSVDGGNNWQASNQFINLAPGNYEVAIRNADGTCLTLNTSSTNLSYPESPEIVAVTTENPAGCGIANGQIQIQITGGEAPIAYSINNGNNWQNSPHFSGLADGIYSVKVRNGDQTCEISYGEVQLNGPSSPIITDIVASPPTDCGLSDGQISIEAGGGSGNFQYSINGGQSWSNNPVFGSLAEGNYAPSIRNADGSCQVDYQSSIQLEGPEPAEIEAVNTSQPSDCALNDGQINIDINGGSQGFQFSINGGNSWSNNTQFSNLAPGNYQVGVRRSDGTCELIYPAQIELDYPPAPSIQSVDVNPPTDCGKDDGRISIQAQNGTGNFEYSINAGQNWVANNTFSDLGPGSYTILVRNQDQSCAIEYNSVIVLDYPASATIAGLEVEGPDDCEASTGSIFIVLDNTNPTTQYSIDGGSNWSTDAFFTGLAAGEYQVAIRNSDGSCLVEYPATVALVDPISPQIVNVEALDPNNCEDNDGQIKVTASSGDGQKQYSIDGGQSWQNSGNFTGLAPGLYQVVIKNADGSCEVFHPTTTTLNAPAAPTFLSVETQAISDCGRTDAQIEVTALAGSGALAYSIDNGGNWQSSGLFNNVSPGTYQIAIQNSNGSCRVNNADLVTIHSLATPEIQNVLLSSPSDCDLNNGSITIEASSPDHLLLYSIDGGALWSDNSTFNQLSPGQYTIGVKNANGTCEVSLPQAVTITALEAPKIEDIQVTQAQACDNPNGSINISASSEQAIRYSIDGGQSWSNNPEFSNLAPGQYSVSIQHTNGSCQVDAQQAITISAPAAPVIQDIQVTQAQACDNPNGSISISASSEQAIQYSIDGGQSWSNNPEFSNLAPGQYSISIQHTNGSCQVDAQQAITISAPAAPVIQDIQVTQAQACDSPNGSISISASSEQAIQYSIDGGQSWSNNPEFSNLAPGQYSVSIQHTNGSCQLDAQQAITISAPAAPVIQDIQVTQAQACDNPNGSISISASSEQAIQYSIDGGQSWSNNPEFSNLAPGQYSISIQHTNGSCQVDAQQAITISAPAAPVIQDIQVTQAQACDSLNGSISISASSEQAIQYSIDGGQSWSNNPNFSNLAPGQYSINIQHTDGSCQVDAQQAITISAPAAPVIQDIQVTQAQACDSPNGSISISASSEQAIQYSIDGGQSWSNNPEFSNLAPGQYSVSIQHTNGSCQVDAQQAITISAPAAPVIQEIQVTQVQACDDPNGSISISASSEQAIQYSIDGGQSWSHNPNFSNLAPGQYSVSIQHTNGSCQVDAQQAITISAPAAPVIQDIQVTQAQACDSPNGSISISASPEQAIQYSIDGGQSWSNNPNFSNLAPGQYSISIQHTNGSCQVDAQQAITISAPAAPVIQDIQVTQAQACDNPNGSISISASSEQAIQYSIDGGQSWSNNPEFSNLAPGQYSISIQHTNGSCQVDAQQAITISAPAAPVILDIQVTHASGCGLADGQIEIELLQTSEHVLYSIDAGETWQKDSVFTHLAPTLYHLLVKDTLQDCQVDYGTVELEGAGVPLIENVGIILPSSCNNADGGIFINLAQEGDFQYSIDGGINWQASHQFNDLLAGTYFVKVSDLAASCESVYEIPVRLPADGAATIWQVNAQAPSNCGREDGEINVLILEDETLFDFSIDNGTSWQDSSKFTGLPSDSYTILVRNRERNCLSIYYSPLHLPEPPSYENLLIQEQRPSACGLADGSILVNYPMTDSARYSIDGGLSWQESPEFLGLAAGVYEIRIQVANQSCTLAHLFPLNLNFTAQQELILEVDQSSDCDRNDGRISIQPPGSGSYLYSIDRGFTYQEEAKFEGLSPGNYIVRVQNINGNCEYEHPAVIEINELSPPEILDVTYANPAPCAANGWISIEADSSSGNLSYSIDGGENWQDEQSIFQDLMTGSYPIAIRYTNGSCFTRYDQEIVLQDTSAQDTLAVVWERIICEGDTLFLGDTLFTAAGDYELFLNNETGCDSLIQLKLNVAFPSLSNVEASICAGASYEIGAQQFTSEGQYTVNLLSALGCDSTINLELSVYQPDTTKLNITLCEGESFYYEELSLDSAGAYTLRRTTENGCDSLIIFNLTYIPSPLVTDIETSPPSSCESVDGQIKLIADSPLYLYSIDHGQSWQNSPIFQALSNGVYSIDIRDQQTNCITTLEVALYSTAIPLIDSLIVAPGQACQGINGRIQFVPNEDSANYQYSITGGLSWENSPIFDNLSAASYDLFVSHADSTCSYFYQTVEIEATDSLVVDILTQEASFCAADSSGIINLIIHQGSSPYHYQWSTGSDLAELEEVPPGRYEVTITDNNDCKDSLTIYLDDVPAVPTLDSLLQDTFLICKGDSLQLALALDNVQYKWWSSNGFSSEAASISIHEAGHYYLQVDDLNGCIQIDSFWVLQSEDYLAANFLLPSKGLVQTSVFAVEVSWPIPEIVHWKYDEDRIKHLSSYLNQEEFLFTETGTFTIGMEAKLGSCQQYIEKKIQIYADPDSIPSHTDPNGFHEILDFSLFPNPTNGQFELLVEMVTAGAAQVRIYRDTGLLMESRNLSGWASYREAFELTDAPSGNYIAVLQTVSEYRTLNFIIQR